MNAIIFTSQGNANSFLPILNSRMIPVFNTDPVNVGDGVHADHLVDPNKPYVRPINHPDENDDRVAVPVDDNVIEYTQRVAYADYPENTTPRPPNDNGFPLPLGDEIRTQIQNGTLVQDISDWFPPDIP